MSNLDVQGIGFTSQRTRDRLAERLAAKGVSNPDVLARIAQTPRHLFVEEAMAHRAYEDTALPIGHDQTISQPLIVAMMTEALLAAGATGRILEVGTGCGYQTAVLAPMVEHVYSIERIAPLLQGARRRLRKLRIHNVSLRHGDGYLGWQDKAPFDGILAAAAPEEVPAALVEQLAEGGVLVMPVGRADTQKLVVARKQDGGFVQESIADVRFVPLLPGTQQ